MHGDALVSSRSLCLPGACEEGEGGAAREGCERERREGGGGGGSLGIEGDGE